MNSARDMVNQLVSEHLARGDALGWFERLYRQAGRDPAVIPWADFKANPNLMEWADRQRLSGHGKSALVVGCGLGDDAEALTGLGFAVTAFDIAPTAIAWARQRFPNSHVDYCVADLLVPPPDWRRRFDFVLEAYTLQVLPSQLHPPAMQRLCELVMKGGTLLLICRGRDVVEPPGSQPPWALTREELTPLLVDQRRDLWFEDYIDAEEPPVRRFRATYLL